MTIEIRKAERFKSKLRLALAGPSGSGKTMGALKLAHGLGGKVCMIDTERGSGDLYANLFDYDIITLKAPFKPDAYIEAIHAAEKAGYDTIIIDSLSHAWSDEGGLLDQADRMEASGKNRFTMWAELTPQHRALVATMLNSTSDIVATVRSKQEYALEKDEKTGKNRVQKLGMGIVQRDGLEYEFTIFFDIDQNHNAHASKDRTDLFHNEIFVIDEKVGERVKAWMGQGRDREELEGKKKIAAILKHLGVELAKGADFVKETTKLELIPANYEEVITRLDVIAKERKEAEKESATPPTPPEAQNAPARGAYVPEEPVLDITPEQATIKEPARPTNIPGTTVEYPDDEINPEDIPF